MIRILVPSDAYHLQSEIQQLLSLALKPLQEFSGFMKTNEQRLADRSCYE